jgi:hypothetical protein
MHRCRVIGSANFIVATSNDEGGACSDTDDDDNFDF